MLEKIRSIVAEMNVSDYRIVEKKTVSHQAFFVKQKLDQHRISDTTHIELTVYMDSEKDGKKFRGSAGKEIFRGESEEDIRKDIEGLKYNATLAVAPYYELVKEEKHSEQIEKKLPVLRYDPGTDHDHYRIQHSASEIFLHAAQFHQHQPADLTHGHHIHRRHTGDEH